MNAALAIVAALLLITVIVLGEVKRACDLRAHWERDEHEQGGP